MIVAIWLALGSGAVLLVVFSYTRKKTLAIVGQSLIICSFALISTSLIHTSKFMVGIAAGLSALYQTFAMIRGQIRRARSSRSKENAVATGDVS